jgi:tRNA threonylcarbamoyladenosine biosynthesis protein TsaE
VLSGIVGALLAGGLDARDAAVAGAWLHGAAARALSSRLGDAGLLSHEIADALPAVRRALHAPPGAAPSDRRRADGAGGRAPRRGLSRRLSDADVVYLEGDLGAGKTTFVRGIARGIGAPEREVASPTFALLNEYVDASGRVRLRHLDLYRLSDDPRQLEVLGIPDAFSRSAGLRRVAEGRRSAALMPATWEVSLEVLADEAGGSRYGSCAYSLRLGAHRPLPPPGERCLLASCSAAKTARRHAASEGHYDSPRSRRRSSPTCCSSRSSDRRCRDRSGSVE